MKEAEVKLFQNSKIRSHWDGETEQWLFSAVDICAALAESKSIDPGAYWRKLKQRLTLEGSEVVTKCHGLKMLAKDGKKYKTDCFYTEDVLRLVQSIPSKKAEPFKQWLAQVGRERIDEINDPEAAIQRAMDTYLSKGYDAEWIIQRLQSIKIRRKLTDEWGKHGVRKGVEYAILTDAISKGWSGMTTREYKDYKGLKGESLRDNMTDLELVFNMLAEATATDITKREDPADFDQNMDIAKRSGDATHDARKALENKLGHSVLSADKTLNNVEQKYIDEYGEKSDEVIILAHIEHSGSLTISETEEIFSNVPRRTLQRRLKKMVDDGILKKRGSTNRVTYYKA